MKMKKILNEWRRFTITEGASNLERAMAVIDNLKKSYDVSNKEAQKKIASIYLPWSLKGSNPKGADDFYSTYGTEKLILEVLMDLIVAVEGLEETDEAVINSNFFAAEHAGQHTQYGNTPVIRIRSLLSDAAQAVFTGPQEIYNRAEHLKEKIQNYDFDFSDLSSEFQPGPGRAGFQRGADAGTGGIQTPTGMTPEEEAEFEQQMEKYSLAHQEIAKSLGKEKNKAHYDMLTGAYKIQNDFYKYMYELWNSKVGEKNQMTAMYKAAAFSDTYGEDLEALTKSPEMQSQFEKEKMSDMSTLEDDFARGMTTTDKAEAEKIFRKLKAARDNRSRLIRQRMRML
jgi:hypothetical protein